MRVAYFLENLSATAPAPAFARLIPHLKQARIDFRCFTSSPLAGLAASDEVISLQPFSATLFPDQEAAQALSDSVSRRLAAFQPQVIHLGDTSLLSLLGLGYARSEQLPLVATYSPQEDDGAEAGYLRWFYGACQLVLVENDRAAQALQRLGLTHARIARLTAGNALVRSRQLSVYYQRLRRGSVVVPDDVTRPLRRRTAEHVVAVPQLAAI
ncbi:MAG: glycosyltransferase [candidate division KSB1 bacterium]|nr:glycosyltransferase [candidate division KSB1 bacterium]MDZ7272890.1 glycosyltransferase [candidate division KSB1 bacterium]MDZ7284087.1 glycosyltransferase [candidate division KSB1 bacterium]MDZ7297515.1 glycosyltransferase [candidate division KSB1 bacterium]MDZ7308251.1 glycosyltransferase [candidate division KSB1 bacterium]